MKKIIDRKRYDTDTATRVLGWSNGLFGSDFGWYGCTLYVTKSGNWFIYGRGGAQTKYATSHCGTLYGGEDITAITADEALGWLEAHDGAEEIEQYFCDNVSDA